MSPTSRIICRDLACVIVGGFLLGALTGGVAGAVFLWTQP